MSASPLAKPPPSWTFFSRATSEDQDDAPARGSRLSTSEIHGESRPLLEAHDGSPRTHELDSDATAVSSPSITRPQRRHQNFSPSTSQAGFAHLVPWREDDDPLLASPASPASPALPAFFPSSSSSSIRRVLSGAPKPAPPYPSRRRAGPFRGVSRRLLDSRASWLALYFGFNLGLTLYNKSVLLHFPFPYTVTALHALCSALGGRVLRRRGVYVPAPLSAGQHAVLLAFSALYALNIAVSNVSLNLVSVPFHQVVRAMTPLFTIAITVAVFRTHPSRTKLLSLIPVVLGVIFATYGDYSFTAGGLCLTLLGAVLAALKTIFTNVLQTRSAPAPPSDKAKASAVEPWRARLPTLCLHPLDLLTRMSPLAFIQCVLYAHASGELAAVRRYSAQHMTPQRLLEVVVNGAIAFGLNVVSFSANRKVGPVTMSVAANVKQVLTILSAVVLFDLVLTPMNLFGIALSLAGGAWYAAVEFAEKRRRTA